MPTHTQKGNQSAPLFYAGAFLPDGFMPKEFVTKVNVSVSHMPMMVCAEILCRTLSGGESDKIPQVKK